MTDESSERAKLVPVHKLCFIYLNWAALGDDARLGCRLSDLAIAGGRFGPLRGRSGRKRAES